MGEFNGFQQIFSQMQNFMQMASQFGMMGNGGMGNLGMLGSDLQSMGSGLEGMGQELGGLGSQLSSLGQQHHHRHHHQQNQDQGDFSGQQASPFSTMGSSMASDTGAGMDGLGSLGTGMDNSGTGSQDWSGCTDMDQAPPWKVTNTGDGQDSVDLGNYTLSLNKANSQWTVTNKATGKTTDISGDPHVNEDGSHAFDFKKNLSFQLDDGTKITVHTVPAGNGQYLSDQLDITQGGHGMKVTGLAGNDGANGLQVADGFNGYALDASNWGTPSIYENGGQWMDQQGQNVSDAVSTQDSL